MSDMHFGILSFAAAPADDLIRLWRAAEDLGFDSAWIADDLLQAGFADFEAWTLLGALARETSRLRIGTLVSSITYRHPAFLAAQAITVDHLSQGRLEVGIGAGGPPNDYNVVGLSAWSSDERHQRLREQVAMLAQLLRGKAVVHEGQYYRATIKQMPNPMQRPRPPLMIAAHGSRGLRLTAAYADGWTSLGGQPMQESRRAHRSVSLTDAVTKTRRLSAQLDTYCRNLDRDPARLWRSVLAYRAKPDPLTSLDAFDEYVGRYEEIGIDEVIFCWPPLKNVLEQQPVTADQQARFEQIATERIAGRGVAIEPSN